MSAKTKSARLKRLLSHGYFAPELPPCFVSEILAKYRKTILSSIDAIPQIVGKPAFHRFISEPIWFYFPRHGKNDRRHGVPNPISYILLSRVVSDNYIDLRNKAKRSGLSSSPPIFDWSGSRAIMRPSIDLRDDFRVDLSSRCEQFVSADIRAFFHSIYTHAIPWAIYGKEWAKNHRGVTHYGNLIDLICRNSQDGQTIGLPVGPDTSRLIAEVIASAMDLILRDDLQISGRNGSRYIDDYTISSVDGRSGEALLASIRQAAAWYELELNNDKSAIYSTAMRQSAGWKQALRASIPTGAIDYASIQHFLYEVGRLCEAHPDINLEKYALQNARTALLRARDWRKIQSILINNYRRNSSLVSFLVEILILRQSEQNDVDCDNLHEFINHRIPVLSRSNRTGELIWLLFLINRLEIRFRADQLTPLYEIQNAMIAILIANAKHSGLIDGEINSEHWNRSLNAAGLRGPMWLYAYEVVRQNFDCPVNDDFIRNDPYFAILYEKKVSFLSIENGFTSMATTLRVLRGENNRMRLLRDDFNEDFEVDFDDIDDDDMDEDFPDNEGY